MACNKSCSFIQLKLYSRAILLPLQGKCLARPLARSAERWSNPALWREESRNGSTAAKSQLGGLSSRCTLHRVDTHLGHGLALHPVTSLKTMALYVVSYDLS